MLTVLLGGARSGKSRLAVEAARRHPGTVAFVATAPRDLADADWAARIDRHRAERPAEWRTVECPVDLAELLERTPESLIVIDCLSLWTSNMMVAGYLDDEIVRRARHIADVASRRPHPVIAVSNEVGSGVHPETDLGRRYRDVHGWVNQAWVAAARTALLAVAGRAIRLDDPWTHLTIDPATIPPTP